jgi:protein TonB
MVIVAIIIPLLNPEMLPQTALQSMLVAPPPPPPPPPPPSAARRRPASVAI